MRTIQTTTFYSKNTLRFPRVIAVRKDKRWSDICTDEQLQEAMWNSGRLTAGIKGDGSGGGFGRGRHGADGQPRAAAPKRGARTVVPGLAAPMTEDIEPESALFANEVILVLRPCDMDAVCKLITKHGGNVVMSWGKVTRVVTEVFSPGLTTKADVAAGVTRYPGQECVDPLTDVLHVSWLQDCVDAGRLLPSAPRHRLRYVAKSEANLVRDLDRYGDRCALARATRPRDDSHRMLTRRAQLRRPCDGGGHGGPARASKRRGQVCRRARRRICRARQEVCQSEGRARQPVTGSRHRGGGAR